MLLDDGVHGVALHRPSHVPGEAAVLEDPFREDVRLACYLRHRQRVRPGGNRNEGRALRRSAIRRERQGPARDQQAGEGRDDATEEGSCKLEHPALNRPETAKT